MSTACDIAIEAIGTALRDGRRTLPSVDDVAARDPLLAEPGASFVTLERGETLLGCVGALTARQALGVDIAEHALGAAFDDPRMRAVTCEDFPVMSVKVSVLSPPLPLEVASYDELASRVRPGYDGVTIGAGRRRATLLPSVWPKVRSTDEFLDALWRKAGLPRRAWPRGLAVETYTTVETCDPGPRQLLSPGNP